jgi:hypothetical protein
MCGSSGRPIRRAVLMAEDSVTAEHLALDQPRPCELAGGRRRLVVQAFVHGLASGRSGAARHRPQRHGVERGGESRITHALRMGGNKIQGGAGAAGGLQDPAFQS